MLILVDGYNVTMNDPALRGRPKEAQRDGLIERLCVLRPTLARGGSLVVVFDAHASLGVSAEERGGVRSVYAPSADDEIVRRAAAAKGRVVIYTGDLRLRARLSQDVGRHLEYRDTSALFVGAGPPGRRRRVPVAREDELPKNARDITAELEDLWLDETKE